MIEPVLKALDWTVQLKMALQLLRSSLALSLSSEVEQQTQPAKQGQGEINTSGVVDVMAREHAFTENYMTL
jgi:hypothetical protein